MAPLDPATIARRPRAVPRVVHHARTAAELDELSRAARARRRAAFQGPMVDPIERSINIWRWETLIGSLLGLSFLPSLWLALYLITWACK